MGITLGSFMTSDMAKGFVAKMEDVYAKSGQAGVEAIDNAYKALVAGKDDATKAEITALINGIDWTNTEKLLYLQQELELKYGYSTEAAKKFTQTIEIAAFATSSLTTTVEVFGELWRATERINQSVERMTQLQWEYDRALKNGGDVSGLTQKMLDEYQLQAQNYATAYEASNTDISKIYAQGALNYGVDLTEAVKLGDYGVEVDESRLQEFIDTGRISQEDADKWLKQLQDQYKTSQSQLDNLRKTLDNIEELEKQGQDAYYELRDMAKEAVLNQMQKQIDLQ
jgi:ABC-type transporter Mla subunit MlaD